jgi:prepilin-type N-terminal cleavage/methylation domain-containing protein
MTLPPFLGKRRGKGFTLIETVVTVGLLAVLAAFVIPSVIRKADSADPEGRQ